MTDTGKIRVMCYSPTEPGGWTLTQRFINQDDLLETCYRVCNCDYVSRFVAGSVDGSSWANVVMGWVDDMGLYNRTELTKVWDYPQPIAGGIVFTGGDDDDGYTKSIPSGLSLLEMGKKLERIDTQGVKFTGVKMVEEEGDGFFTLRQIAQFDK